MIFGNWRPGGLLIGALLFGYTEAAQLRSGGDRCTRCCCWSRSACSRSRAALAPQASTAAVVIGVVGARARWLWYLTTDEVPRDFTGMTPYVATLLVLAFASQRLRMPAADGQIYRKGSAG